jgi:O-methyltransferase involved in polyketide biosynthesis
MAIEPAEQLSTVSKTLFLTLFARAYETQHPGRLFIDDKAVRVLQAFERSRSQSRPDWATCAGVAIRTDILDRQTRHFLASARSCVVNLGAGLCTRYFRLGQPSIDWIEIDFPDVIAVRRSVLPETAYHRMIACSVTDHAWIEQIPYAPGARPLFIAEGLFLYLRDSEIKELLLALKQRFSGCQMLVDTASSLFYAAYAWHPSMGDTGMPFHRGTIGSQRQLNRWSSGIFFEDEWLLLDHHPERWRWLAPLRHIPGLRHSLKVVSLRLNGVRTQ